MEEWKKRNTAGEDMHNLLASGAYRHGGQALHGQDVLTRLLNKWREIEEMPYVRNYAEEKFGKVHRVDIGMD